MNDRDKEFEDYQKFLRSCVMQVFGLTEEQVDPKLKEISKRSERGSSRFNDMPKNRGKDMLLDMLLEYRKNATKN